METTEMIDAVVPEVLTEDVSPGLNPVAVVTAIAVVAATVVGVVYWRKRKQADEIVTTETVKTTGIINPE